jgi:hypothetical protein
MEVPPMVIQEKKKAKFKVAITYNGLKRQLEVHPDDTMQVITDNAVKLFEVTDGAHLLALFDEQNHEFADLTQSAEDAGLEKHEKLVLRQSEVRGG